MDAKRILVTLCLSTALAAGVPQEVRALVLYNSEAVFLAEAPIASVETFDTYITNYGFITPSIVIDGVSYSTNECTNRCWTFYSNNVSPPNGLISNAIGENVIRFGTSRYVEAIGFWFNGGVASSGNTGPAFWGIQVTETNGLLTSLPIQALGAQYFGFVSETGISRVTIRDNPEIHGASNWILDNVARAEILGGTALADSTPVPPPALGGPDGPAGVPEPGTVALLSLGLLMLTSITKKRRVHP